MEKKKERKGNPSQCNNAIVDNRCKFVTEKTNKISAILFFEIILFHKNEEIVEFKLFCPFLIFWSELSDLSASGGENLFVWDHVIN